MKKTYIEPEVSVVLVEIQGIMESASLQVNSTTLSNDSGDARVGSDWDED